MTLKPALGYDKALILSHVFHRVARKHHLDPRMLVAIAYQESAFNLSAIRKVSGFDMDRDRNYAEVTVGSDFCMMQINSANIRHYGFDIERLLTDAEYCITAGATILNGFKKRFGQLEEFWWTRYNACSTAHRELYRKLVDRHWGKILPPPERTCSSEFAGDRFMDDL
ncbi:MAG: lytic transglycosylase domain-containing protein [Deltaproteobacteria bacterium]|nr:lytic transglycosylase domain-containing protein [Deltaproteobacteria bacterium]